MELTARYLRDHFSYDRATGLFRYRIAPRNSTIRAGDVAGWMTDEGYVAIEIRGKSHKAHRLAVLHVNGRWPKEAVDHRNGLKSDNRWDNLREATKAENGHNRAGANRNSKTGLLGVKVLTYKERQYYRAAITANGKRVYLGTHPTAEAAHAAYMKAKGELHPFAER